MTSCIKILGAQRGVEMGKGHLCCAGQGQGFQEIPRIWSFIGNIFVQEGDQSGPNLNISEDTYGLYVYQK